MLAFEMAETKTQMNEREYVIPLRREWMKVARYKRSKKSVVAIKEFIARHMRVKDRDTKLVKVDKYLNNEIWFRGGKKPPAKIKVRAAKDSDGVVKVDFVEVPEHVKFIKARQEKIHKKAEKKKKAEPSEEEKQEKAEKTEEEKKEEEAEKEKARSVGVAAEKAAEKAAKAQKHTVKGGAAPQVQRKALKK